ncbi:MAG: translation elongation factor 4 [Candidatus Aegiribacteria sp.]|nr:translation elongation factor 4 [Candidatus Aegiribacteria sp.]
MYVEGGALRRNIRNFCIIAHIDHGKSTLADRLLQATGTVSAREFHDLMLDTMDIEQERGITIKSTAVTMNYTSEEGIECELNLIDTPGHVDFSYEVSRALASCEGALLVIDAAQGVEAQTVANLYKAMEQNLTIIPVINKIDLSSANILEVMGEIEGELGLDVDDTICVSAKTGEGIEELLEAIVKKIPPPDSRENIPLRARVFDSIYDPYRGVVVYFRIEEGSLTAGEDILMMAAGKEYTVEEVGHFGIKREPCSRLTAGEVGYLIAGIKTVEDVKSGDTVTCAIDPALEPLGGYEEVKPVVFSSIYPVSSEDYESLVAALERLKLNDASLIYEKVSSPGLGFGFRCGFLGLLHLEVVQERLEREFYLSLVLTAPTVRYRITLTDGSVISVDNPVDYPDPASIALTEEPFIRASIIMPDRYIGPVTKLILDRRGENYKNLYVGKKRVEISADIPLGEVVYDFYDKLKSVTQGYGSFDYEITDYRPGDLVKVDILVNHEKVEALSMLVHRNRARPWAVAACKNLKEEIPKQQFKIPIQGAIGGQVISRETINALRKDVTAKCYGGDITRKRKLLEKQKAGKKRMKMVGSVAIPQKAFLAVLRRED